jgi:galactokinase
MHKLHEQVKAAFAAEFGHPPTTMIRAPGRVNLIGEHTDYNDGFVLPMAIDRAVWLGIQPRQDNKVVLHSLNETKPAAFSLDHFEHNNAGWAEYVKGIAWSLANQGYPLHGWEGVLSSDVPIGAGLSSSAALEMAVARAFAHLSGWAWDAGQMALVGQAAENQWVGANTGIMDQMISAAGRAGHALLIDCRDLSSRHIPLPAETAVVIMDTMTRHTHTDSGYNERREQCETAARFFGVSHLRDVEPTTLATHARQLDELVGRRARHVITENGRVLQAANALTAGDAGKMGQLMNESHVSMRDDFEITNDELNIMVNLAQNQAGCYGARMTGGGFGGCAVALVASSAAEQFAVTVAKQYQTRTKLEPRTYICEASDGATVF